MSHWAETEASKREVRIWDRRISEGEGGGGSGMAAAASRAELGDSGGSSSFTFILSSSLPLSFSLPWSDMAGLY